MSPIHRVVLAVLVVAAATLGWSNAAAAHTAFESSEPADGAVVTSQVDEIVVRFTGVTAPTGEGFLALDSSGVIRVPDTASADPAGMVWTLGFDPPLAAGVVGFRWTVQAPDTHPINGSFRFTIAPPDLGPPTDSVDPSGPTPDSRPDAAVRTEAPSEAVEQPATDPDGRGVTRTASAAVPAQLDEFLDTTGAGATGSGSIAAFGRLLSFAGTMIGVGGLAIACFVIRDRRGDVVFVLNAVSNAGVIIVIGTAIDLVAHMAVANNGWASFWSGAAAEQVLLSTFGVAVYLRLAAGALLHFATPSMARTVPVQVVAAPQGALAAAGGDGTRSASAPTDAPRPLVERTEGAAISQPVAVAVVVLMASFAFDGHTATAGNPWVTGAIDGAHVLAASTWAGGVAAIATVLWRRHRSGSSLNGLELAFRFSVIAAAALTVAGIAGSVLAVIILDRMSELWSTPWGRLLIIKALAVATAAAIGGYNHFVVLPWLQAHPADDRRSVKLRKTTTAEALTLTLVLIVTAFLVSASSQ